MTSPDTSPDNGNGNGSGAGNGNARGNGSGQGRIVIAGAGLAGALQAVMLARRGFHVTIYEKRADMRTTDLSAGRSINLALASRGIRALDHAGLMDRVTPILVPMPGRLLHDEAGQLQYQPYGHNPGEINYSVSRADLNRVLMSAAEETGRVRIRFEHEVQDMDFAAGVLLVRDLQTGDLLEERDLPVIAADGAGSPVRRAMIQRLGIEHGEDLLDHAYKELTIPPAVDGGWRIERDALHIWPRGGYMLIALPNLDGSFTCTLFLAREGEPSFASLTTPEQVTDFFRERFPDALALIPELARDFFDNPTGMLGTVRCRPWHHRGQILLIGDAAHAIVPFHGQGMNCAFEDCVALDRLVGAHDADAGGDLDWAAIFAAFTAARKPSADAIAQMALENYIEMRDAVRDPAFHLRKQVEFLLEERFPGRFVPRYSMVMFHPEISYADALDRGARQDTVLDRLTAGHQHLADIDLDHAAALLDEAGL